MSGGKKHGNLPIFVPHIGCPHRCTFCDQRTISGAKNAPTPKDVERLCVDALTLDSDRKLELAFFGGSFTAIDRDYMISLLEAADKFIGQGISGIRLSTRPDAVGEEVLEILKRYHVTAIELGVQSMSDEVLIKNRRGHTAADVEQAVERIKRFGFELGLQMMIGLDGDTEETTLYTAERIIGFAPDTVRIYPTIALDHTELGERLKKGEYTALTLEEGVRRTARVMELFGQKAPDIRIIRVGLHPSEEVERNMLGGPYHPAFRELCESEIMKKRLLSQLEKLGKGSYRVLVNPKDISRMNGQKRKNVQSLAALGYDITVVGDERQQPLYPIIDRL